MPPRSEPCACGGAIVVELPATLEAIAAAIEAHNALAIHRLYRRIRPTPALEVRVAGLVDLEENIPAGVEFRRRALP